MSSHRVQRWVLLAIGATALACSILASYARFTFADSDEFASRVDAALDDPIIRAELSQAAVEALVDQEAELITIQPLLINVVEGLLASDAGSSLMSAAVRDLHRTLFTDNDDTVFLQVSELLLVAKAQITALSPQLGAMIPDDLTDSIVEARANAASVDSAQIVASLDQWVFVLLAIAAVAFVGVLWRSPDASAGLAGIGVGLIASAVVTLVAVTVGQLLLIGRGTDVELAVWDAFVDPLDSWILAVAGTGAVIAVIAWFGVGELDSTGRFTELADVMRRRTTPAARLGWGVSFVLLGVLVLLNRDAVLQLAIVLVGVFALAAGVREIVAIVAPSLVEGVADRRRNEPEDGRPDDDRSDDGPATAGRIAASIGVGFVAIAAIVGVARGTGGEGNDAAADTACNGSDDLCSRPFDQVVMAATHNSHAAADDGFLNGYQQRGLVRQLEDGVRGFLLDVYFGFDDDTVVVTDRAPLDGEEREALVADVGESAVLAAEATAASFEDQGITAEMFLCHALCEIGASRFTEQLSAMKTFLDEHPREVITIIIQDEGPLPDDIAAAFEQSGMIELVYAHESGRPFPTLEEMIGSNRRVVVSAENRSGGYDWYHDAFELTQDTAFSYESIDEFECSINRGTADGPLLLVNHWVNPVSPVNADDANSATVLLDRVEECEAERGMRPNLIAVDFYERGDLLAVVGQLN